MRAGRGDDAGARLQRVRQQLQELQADIDGCDATLDEGRTRKRRRLGAGAPASLDAWPARTTTTTTNDEEGYEGYGMADGWSSEEELLGGLDARMQLGPLLARKKQLQAEARAATAAAHAAAKDAAARRRELRVTALARAEVVGATLSSAGGELLQLVQQQKQGGGAGRSRSLPLFDAVICDEAAQARDARGLACAAPGGRTQPATRAGRPTPPHTHAPPPFPCHATRCPLHAGPGAQHADRAAAAGAAGARGDGGRPAAAAGDGAVVRGGRCGAGAVVAGAAAQGKPCV